MNDNEPCPLCGGIVGHAPACSNREPIEPDAQDFGQLPDLAHDHSGPPFVSMPLDGDPKISAGESVDPGQPASKPLERKDGQSVKKASYRKHTASKVSAATKQAIIALSRGNETQAEIIKRLHVSPSTVQAVLTAQAKWEDSKTVETIRKGNAAFWWVTSRRALESITDEKLVRSSALQLGTLAAMATDKARLSEGLPTVRIEYQGQEDEALQARIAQLEGVLAQSDGYKVIQAEQVKP